MNTRVSFPRVAFFTDCYHEVNGIATTSRQLVDFARRHGRPMMVVCCGPTRSIRTDGSVTYLELRRGWASLAVERDLGFDPALWRETSYVRRALREFQPDVVHVTSPGDVGLLGFYLSRTLPLPLVASWHTNLHEFAASRCARFMPWAPTSHIEDWSLRVLRAFYRRARVSLAPNPEWVKWLHEKTGKPCLLMRRGVDGTLFHPAKRTVKDDVFRLGFVGRVSPEKNVRLLVEIEKQLLAAGHRNFRFVVVGDGSELAFLRTQLKTAEFRGVLRGEELVRAYADMDAFVFPSHTDTFGNVVLEAMASGVVPVVSSRGGPKYLIDAGVNGFIANEEKDFATHLDTLIRDPQRLSRMRQTARAQAIESSWQEALEVVYDAYKLALNRGQSVHVSDEGIDIQPALPTRMS